MLKRFNLFTSFDEATTSEKEAKQAFQSRSPQLLPLGSLHALLHWCGACSMAYVSTIELRS